MKPNCGHDKPEKVLRLMTSAPLLAYCAKSQHSTMAQGLGLGLQVEKNMAS